MKNQRHKWIDRRRWSGGTSARCAWCGVHVTRRVDKTGFRWSEWRSAAGLFIGHNVNPPCRRPDTDAEQDPLQLTFRTERLENDKTGN